MHDVYQECSKAARIAAHGKLMGYKGIISA